MLQTFIDVRRESYQIDESGNALPKLAGGYAAETPMKVQKFGGRQPFVKAEIFRQESDFSADFNISRRRSEDKRLAVGGSGKAEKHLDGSALARPVRPEKTKYLASRHSQGQVAHRDLAPENLAQILCLDRVAIPLGQSRLLLNQTQILP